MGWHNAKGVFRINGNAVEHYGHTEGLSGDTVWTLFEDREGIVWAATSKGIDSFRDPAITTFSHWKAWPPMQQSAFWLVKTVRSGLQTMALSTASPMERSPLFERGLVFRVNRSPRYWKTEPETYGWEWIMDYIYSKMVDSAAYLSRMTSRLEWWLE